MITRELGNDDWPEALRLGIEGFGGKPPAERPTVWPPAGQTGWGTFDGDRMVARLAGRAYHSWFDGVEVPTLGVAGVTVEAEHRGEGLLTGLFAQLLEPGDAVISTLYPTAPGIYRRFGYEIVGVLREVEIPTSHLAGVPAPVGVRARRATEADVPAIHECYTRWASEQNGPLTRTGPLFEAGEILTSFTGATVAVDADDEVVGYALWQRGSGYDADATLTVEDLVADTVDAVRALWRMISSFASVTGQVRLSTSGDDVTRLVLPSLAWREVRTNPYMLRILDVPGALSLRRTAPGLSADLTFAVRGDQLGRIDGDYRLTVADGTISCTTGSDAAERTYSPQGLALAYAGVQSSANLRRAGHLSGPADADPAWDALLAGRQLHIRDYF